MDKYLEEYKKEHRNKALNLLKGSIPKYIKDGQIQHYRFFTCCDDINNAIKKGRIKYGSR